MLLRKRAEDILDMVEKTADELRHWMILQAVKCILDVQNLHQLKYLAQTIQEFKKNIRCCVTILQAEILSKSRNDWTGD